MMSMPGHSHKGPLPPLTNDQATLRDRLRGHVTKLAGKIGERNVLHYRALQQAAQYVTSRFQRLGLTVREEPYRVEDKEVVNIEAELKGTEHPEEIVVIGAHYDSVSGTAGANDWWRKGANHGCGGDCLDRGRGGGGVAQMVRF